MERQNDGKTELKRKASKFSLAFYKTTPKLFIFLISSLIIFAHVLFAYSQISPMWRLFYQVNANVTLEATNAESQFIFSNLNLVSPFHVSINEEREVRTFTYGFAVKELWKAKNLASTIGPRIAALLLILFSGVWPHLKLLLLHYFWLFPVDKKSRTTAFYWLSTFGKWSFADVFVVCVLIGVLNLDLEVQPQLILDGLISEFPQLIDILETALSADHAKTHICKEFLGLDCGPPVGKACSSCQSVVALLYERPSWVKDLGVHALQGIKPLGGGHASLRVGGILGIYLFCCAVVLSLLLSFTIDIFDRQTKHSDIQTALNTPEFVSGDFPPSDLSHNAPASPKFYFQNHHTDSKSFVRKWLYPFLHLILPLFTLASVTISIFAKSMQRDVKGSLPQIADTITGINYEKDYSLWSLNNATAASGGADYFLMGTFAMFCLVGPAARAILSVVHFFCNFSSKRHQTFILNVITVLRAFCAWEVFTVALIMVDLEMPQITDTIIDEKKKICRVLHQTANFPATCFTVELDILTPYAYVIVSWVALTVVALLIIEFGSDSLDGKYSRSNVSYQTLPALESDMESYKLLGDEQEHGQS